MKVKRRVGVVFRSIVLIKQRVCFDFIQEVIADSDVCVCVCVVGFKGGTGKCRTDIKTDRNSREILSDLFFFHTSIIAAGKLKNKSYVVSLTETLLVVANINSFKAVLTGLCIYSESSERNIIHLFLIVFEAKHKAKNTHFDSILRTSRAHMKQIKLYGGREFPVSQARRHGKEQLSCGDDSVRPGWMGEGHRLPAP